MEALIHDFTRYFIIGSSLTSSQEPKPSYSSSLDESSYIKDLRWRRKSENSYLLLSNTGSLYRGTHDGPIKHLMDNVDAGTFYPSFSLN